MNPNEAIATILTAYVLESSEDEEKLIMKKRRKWTKDWVIRRQQEGFFAKLLIELWSEEINETRSNSTFYLV